MLILLRFGTPRQAANAAEEIRLLAGFHFRAWRHRSAAEFAAGCYICGEYRQVLRSGDADFFAIPIDLKSNHKGGGYSFRIGATRLGLSLGDRV